MSRPAKRQMPIVRTKQIQTVRAGKSIWIAVRGSEHRHYPRILSDGFSAKLHVGGCNSRGVLHWRFEAEKFLNCGANDLGMIAQLLKIIGIAKQRQKSTRDQVRRG